LGVRKGGVGQAKEKELEEAFVQQVDPEVNQKRTRGETPRESGSLAR